MLKITFTTKNDEPHKHHIRSAKIPADTWRWLSILALPLFLGCGTDGPESVVRHPYLDHEVEETSDSEVDTSVEPDSADTEGSALPVDTATEDTADAPETDTAPDECPDDPRKTAPGQCGCGKSDSDSDGDGVADCVDVCPRDPNKTTLVQCGCGVADPDSDGDGTADCKDDCPKDPDKTHPGACGCGKSEGDRDEDGTPDCQDLCPTDPTKAEPLVCGCGAADIDSDEDGTLDCFDACPDDPDKTSAGLCGCGVPDTDADENDVPDCNEIPLEYVKGLERTHQLDSDGDGLFETEVCGHLRHLWLEDEALSIADRYFGFRYGEGTSPCEDIDPYDRWLSVFEGFLYLTIPDGLPGSHEIQFVADVNDGVRLVLMDPAGTEEICRMELWQDVPEYDNYHSTDGYEIDHGCSALLTAGVYYPMKLEVYHESDINSPNYLFNRAYLDMFYWKLPTGGSIRFYRAAQGAQKF